jgi:predicted nucleotidyltransferase
MTTRNLNKEMILSFLAEHARELHDYGVNQNGLFGSYASNKANEDSDIDLLVDISKDKKTFRNFMQLSYFLEELLGKKVELVTVQSLSPLLVRTF